ncbi:MAG: hypothetical protein ACRC2J_06475 [Microcoleaceae cyanobacterium]
MRHTLLRHFQGVLLGAWIGQALTNDHPGNFPWQVLAKVLVDSLGQNTGHINWQEVWKNIDLSPVSIDHLTKTSTESVNSIDQSSIFPSKKSPTFTQIFAGLLPIVLFYHENSQQLERELTKANNGMVNSQWIKDLALTEQEILRRQIMINNLATIIAGLLQEKYQLSKPSNHQAIFACLFYQLSSEDPLYHQLLLLQNLLSQGDSLHRAIALLQTNGKNLAKETVFDHQVYEPILLALYCFLDTPHNSKIAMYRGMQCPGKTDISLLLGILFGANHSRSGIPISWQISNILETNEINLMAEKLWQAWSGFYLPHNNADGSIYNTNIAIASCNIMRPRASR